MDDQPTILIDPTVRKLPFDRATHCRNIGHLGGMATLRKYAPQYDPNDPDAPKCEYFAELGRRRFAALMRNKNLTRREAVLFIQKREEKRKKQPIGIRQLTEVTRAREAMAAD